ncbi:TM9 protein B [Cavenderia fasciculata]|uniref:Transmembrane 9 superfamily member n=1 Tax=Cavenderia fasciculata TaxID=261658 RepID=F4Q874_CACFS|nr:TM9 protein B [Cavenderia fasciculata]EGG15974.1 TM9 protein B [Cavenderia fasciculata]|eukprot:XP_004352299.1 TM9 protein B [Cavenderia fasciculata]
MDINSFSHWLQIQELDVDDNVVQELIVDQWNVTDQSGDDLTSLHYRLLINSTLYPTLSSIVNVTSLIEYSTKDRQLPFGDSIVSVGANSIKVGVNVTGWQYQSILSHLRVVFSTIVNNEQSTIQSCSSSDIPTFEQILGSDSYLRVIKNDTQFYGRFLSYSYSDGRKTFSRNELINQTKIVGNNNNESLALIGVHVPQCTFCLLDPDFSALVVNNEKVDCSSSSSSNTWKIIVGCVVGGAVFIALVIALVFYLRDSNSTRLKIKAAKIKMIISRSFNSMMMVMTLSAVLMLFVINIDTVNSTAKDHKYEHGDDIPFYVNNVGPYSNPTETYEYYSLPFCKPEHIKHKKSKLGEILQGDSAVLSDYKLPFKTNFQSKVLCEMTLTKENIDTFKKAIREYYYAEMIYDDLPIFGHIGTFQDDPTSPATRYVLFTHLPFKIEFNNNQIIRIELDTNNIEGVELADQEELKIQITYAASWTPSEYPFSKRMELYEDFFPKELQIHWLSIMNSFFLVILLTGFLSIIIMKILKNDYSRYSKTDDEEEGDYQEDYGWKLIHGEVFRFPPHKNLFSAFYGIGWQFIIITSAILLLSLFGLFYPNNGGNMYTAGIIFYALTSVVSGYQSSKMYKNMGGTKWAWNIVLSATLFMGPFILVAFLSNTIAVTWHSTHAIPILTIIEILTIWIFVGFPLTVVGGIAGRRFAPPLEVPCRTKNFPREIPPIPWYRRLPCQMMMAGFLPFSAIYIELFYIFNSVWGHNSYTLYGILCVVFIILLIVTACITVAFTYFQLSMEDHRWWWTSFINGGSHMYGLLQTTFYFTYMFIVCLFFFILLGTVGFVSSFIFVKRIYKNLKSD